VSGTWRTLTDGEADATGRKPAVPALVPETAG
jgi:hypothetical protein